MSKFDVSSFSVTGEIDFQTSHFADFEQFKVNIYFTNLGQVKIRPIWSFLIILDKSQLFYWVWVRHAAKNDPNPLRLLKIQEPRA